MSGSGRDSNSTFPERGLRIDEFAAITGYKPDTIRKKISRREIAFHRIGRIITIPESELERLREDFHPAVNAKQGEL